MPSPLDYRVEFLHDIEQLRQCVEIQKLAWGFADEDLLPLRSLVICTKIGGQVCGALDSAGRVLGFVNAFPGYRDGKVYLHSQMMGVRPEYQNLGIGKRLKLAQREEALQRGIGLIEWTFDPFQVRNARFNIELLGAVCRQYLVNIYGVTSSRLHGGLPTDRLVAEWHLNSSRVKHRIETGMAVGPKPEAVESVEIPFSLSELTAVEPDRAAQIQLALRLRLRDLFSKNYYVTRFEIDRTRQRAVYLLDSLAGPTPFL